MGNVGSSKTGILEECNYLPLPVSVHKEIQQKFSNGVTLEKIMSGKHCVYNRGTVICP